MRDAWKERLINIQEEFEPRTTNPIGLCCASDFDMAFAIADKGEFQRSLDRIENRMTLQRLIKFFKLFCKPSQFSMHEVSMKLSSPTIALHFDLGPKPLPVAIGA